MAKKERYLGYIFGSMKSSEITRRKAGTFKGTTKLPTSLEEMKEALDHEHRSAEQRTLNPSGRGSSPR